MYACKQSWLDYSLLFCPDQKPDDGRVWLVIMFMIIIIIITEIFIF